jgi:hypothetical protein
LIDYTLAVEEEREGGDKNQKGLFYLFFWIFITLMLQKQGMLAAPT